MNLRYKTSIRGHKSIMVVTLLFIGLFLSGFRTAKQDADSIVEDYLNKGTFETQTSIIKMVTLDRRGNVETREILHATHKDKGGNRLALFRIMGPEKVEGVALLSKTPASPSEEYVQYLYLPGLNKVKKIIGSGKKGNFIDTDFAFEDLMIENPDDFKYNRSMDTLVEGEMCYKVIAVPANDLIARASAYKKRELFIRKSDSALVQVEFYTHNQDPIKTLKLSDFEVIEVDSKTVMHAVRAQMDNHENHTTSMFVITRKNYSKPLDKEYFTPEKISSWTLRDNENILTTLKP